MEKIISGWGNYPKLKTKIITDPSDNELLYLTNNNSIIYRGMGRSYSDQSINSQGYTIQPPSNKYFYSFNELGHLVCDSSITLGEIIETFAPKGWFPPIVPGTKHVTLAGAISNDIHGKSHHVDGSFINCVRGFSILLYNGNTIWCSRDRFSDLFWAAHGGLGLLGIIKKVEIELKKIKSTWIEKTHRILPLKNLFEQYSELENDWKYSVSWIDFTQSDYTAVLSLGNDSKELHTDNFKLHPKPISLPRFKYPKMVNRTTIKILNSLLYHIQTTPGNITHYEPFFFPLDKIDNWNLAYGSNGFCQYQFVLPIDKTDVIISMLDLIKSTQDWPFLNVLKKFGHESNYLSFPWPGWTLALDFPITKTLPDLLKKLDQIVLENQGRIYLAKDAFLDAETFRSMYPEWKSWKKVKEKYDPANKFQSDLGRRLQLC